jgi:flagellar hook-length control protein FliK
MSASAAGFTPGQNSCDTPRVFGQRPASKPKSADSRQDDVVESPGGFNSVLESRMQNDTKTVETSGTDRGSGDREGAGMKQGATTVSRNNTAMTGQTGNQAPTGDAAQTGKTDGGGAMSEKLAQAVLNGTRADADSWAIQAKTTAGDQAQAQTYTKSQAAVANTAGTGAVKIEDLPALAQADVSKPDVDSEAPLPPAPSAQADTAGVSEQLLNHLKTEMTLDGMKTEIKSGQTASLEEAALTEAKISKQVSRHIAANMKTGVASGTMKLSLTPPHLGRVDITFEKQGDSLVVSFKVESTEAMDALRNSSSELSQIMLNKGGEWRDVTIRVDVDTEDGEEDGRPQDQSGDSQQQNDDSHDEWQDFEEGGSS